MDTKKINALFAGKLRVINLGLTSFADNLKHHDVRVTPMAWRPPAGGNEKMMALLKKLGK